MDLAGNCPPAPPPTSPPPTAVAPQTTETTVGVYRHQVFPDLTTLRRYNDDDTSGRHSQRYLGVSTLSSLMLRPMAIVITMTTARTMEIPRHRQYEMRMWYRGVGEN